MASTAHPPPHQFFFFPPCSRYVVNRLFLFARGVKARAGRGRFASAAPSQKHGGEREKMQIGSRNVTNTTCQMKLLAHITNIEAVQVVDLPKKNPPSSSSDAFLVCFFPPCFSLVHSVSERSNLCYPIMSVTFLKSHSLCIPSHPNTLISELHTTHILSH